MAEYLDYIGLPPSFHPSANPTLDLSYLTTLFTHQITAIPYENLLLHYSPSGLVSLDPQVLFTKIIRNRRGRGGYCMENALFFLHMLHTIGFTSAYTVGVRIRLRDSNGVPSGPFTGFVHLVILLTLPSPPSPSSPRYVLDCAFGGDGPTLPLPLITNLTHHNSIGTQEIRFSREFIPTQRFRGEGAAKMWLYQYRNGTDKEWNTFYAFDPDFEFMEADFNVMSWYTSTSKENMQGGRVLVIRFLREEGKVGGRVTGKVMLVNEALKRNLGGKTEMVKVCRTEEERVEVFREWFGIELTEEEKGGIRGRAVELRG